LQYQRLVLNATLHSRDDAGLMTDPELSLMWIGTGRGGPMPRGQNDIVPVSIARLLSWNIARKARDAAIEAEKDRQLRELRRTR
jgi:hypothetical protein